MLNCTLTTPALEISLAWLYALRRRRRRPDRRSTRLSMIDRRHPHDPNASH